MPTIRLDEAARNLLMQYRWPGNIRQLRNVAEQISVLEKERNITASELRAYLPSNAASANLPAVVDAGRKGEISAMNAKSSTKYSST